MIFPYLYSRNKNTARHQVYCWFQVNELIIISFLIWQAIEDVPCFYRGLFVGRKGEEPKSKEQMNIEQGISNDEVKTYDQEHKTLNLEPRTYHPKLIPSIQRCFLHIPPSHS